MKAVVLTHVGTDNNLKFIEIDLPKIQHGQVLIKVGYCGINHLDLLIKSGKRPGPKQLPHILGSEIVGEVIEIQDNQIIKTGDKVAVYPWLFCANCKQCKNGFENICDNGGTIGRNIWGGYAEYIIAPVQNILKIPEDLDLKKVCALGLAGTTANHLIRRSNIKSGSTVLVTGATGGVGLIVIQLLKNKNCKIIAATSNKGKIKQLYDTGVDFVINTEDLEKETYANFPQGVDFAVDIVGGNIWSRALKTLSKNGTMVFCATSQEDMGEVEIGLAFSKQLNILGSYGGTINDFKEIILQLKEQKIEPFIYDILPLKDIFIAHKILEDKKVFGKVLLKI